jgi:malonyl CoA-acyl carrier protein transacylase
MTQLAFVFPGQGSQQLGMLADVAEQYPLIRQTFGEASDALGLIYGNYAKKTKPNSIKPKIRSLYYLLQVLPYGVYGKPLMVQNLHI